MKERRAAEELMLQNMVLSENGARRLETAAADAEARAASDAGRRKPRVFVKPCELCLGIRAEAAKSRDPRAGVKLCTRCQIKARDLAAAEVRRVREEEAAAAAAAAEAEAAAWLNPSPGATPRIPPAVARPWSGTCGGWRRPWRWPERRRSA